jgi:hypothetical protein
MKQTAVGELLEYFVKQQKEGCSHWCIHDLIAQLYVAKEMEKEQIIDAYLKDIGKVTIDKALVHWDKAEEYYNETFKSE